MYCYARMYGLNKASFLNTTTSSMRELMSFRMGITCISETKRFGKDVYEIDGYTVLHSDHDIPGSGDALQCGEGVAIVLDPVLSVAWRDAGEVWTAVNSRFVSARLQMCLGGSGCASSKLNVSVYAPTHGAPLEVKERFYDDLQTVIDSVPSSDVLLTMGILMHE